MEAEFGVGNLHDYGARWYDASIGRFTTVDPLAEKYSFQSPYAYATNNPVLLRDIMGMGVTDIYVDEDGNYLGSDGAKTKDVRVIDKKDWEYTKETRGVETESGTNALQESSTKLKEYQSGISISDGAWLSIESDGGKRMAPTVQNNSSVDAFVLPEHFQQNAVTLNPGEGYYSEADGVSTAVMRIDEKVYKMGDGAKVELTGSGTVKNVNLSAKLWAGEKGASYLTKQANKSPVNWAPHPPQHAHYNHWARLYGKPMMSPNTLVPTAVH